MTNDISSAAATTLQRFRGMTPVDPRSFVGLWRGTGVPTNHPLDGVLENLGWYGKRFLSNGSADALLFERSPSRLIAIQPAFIPLRLALHGGSIGRTRVARNCFWLGQRFLRARGPTASIVMQDFERIRSAAMVYDRLPITDHFRREADDRVMGMMSVRDVPRPYFFILTREA